MSAVNNKGNNKKNKDRKTRKENRKEKRKLKRINRNAYYTNKNKKASDKKLTNENISKKASVVKPKGHKNELKTQKPKKQFLNNVVRDLYKERNSFKNLENEMLTNRKKLLQEDIEMEDHSIRKLEKQLNLKNKKNISKSFIEDGLDYILDLCDTDFLTQKAQNEKQLVDLQNIDESGDDLIESADSENSYEDNDQDNIDETLNGDQDNIDETLDNDLKSNLDNLTTDSASDITDHESGFSENYVQNKIENIINKDNCESDYPGTDGNQFEEDIYGRKRDKFKNIIQENSGKYIPPQIRAQMLSSNQAEKIQHLRRQIKGLLNKLTEKNINSISKELEDIYMNNSQYDTNNLLTNLSLEFLIQVNIVPDIMMGHYAMLISILHANISSDIGAYFIQNLVKQFYNLISEKPAMENKKLENVTSILSHLYNFKIYSSHLLFDILMKLSENLNEKYLDCILIILKVSGFLLRKECPGGLKEVIVKLQADATHAMSTMKQSSRVKFLVDVLLAIKNNNISKIPLSSPTQLQELQKLVKNYYRKGNYVTTLNVRLNDLLNADEHGRWWSVGSAWSGNENDYLKKNQNTGFNNTYSEKLLALARKQRMNTEIRKNIFCAIMSGEDYLNAFQKVLSLSLKGNQEQEVVHVVLSCCLQEQKYNPYYSLLALKFCELDRKYRISFQYSLWDKIKDLSSLTNAQLKNLAKFMTDLLVENGLSLSVLKIIDFSELQTCEFVLIKQILFNVLLNNSESIVTNIFVKIARSPNLKMFCQSLRLFLNHLLLGNKKAFKKLEEKSKILLEERINIVNQILTAAETRM